MPGFGKSYAKLRRPYAGFRYPFSCDAAFVVEVRGHLDGGLERRVRRVYEVKSPSEIRMASRTPTSVRRHCNQS